MAITSTQSLVIDLIVQKIQGLGLPSIIDLPCPVFDGPVGTDEENNYVVVHGWPGDNSNLTAGWVGLGARARDEEYDIAIAVCCFEGGITLPDNFDVNDAQATARSNAKLISAAIEQAMLDDITLAVANGGSPPASPFWTEMRGQQLVQGEPEDENFMGRFCQITMRCHIFARLLSA